MRDGVEIGDDDPDGVRDEWCGSAGEIGANDRGLDDRGAGPGGGPAQRALLGVSAAAAGRLHVGALLFRLRAPVIQQHVGTGQGGPGAQKDGEEKPGEKPTLHASIIPPSPPCAAGRAHSRNDG
jgi:hypothetical protein